MSVLPILTQEVSVPPSPFRSPRNRTEKSLVYVVPGVLGLGRGVAGEQRKEGYLDVEGT